MPCYSPLKGFRDAETGGLIFSRPAGAPEMEVACGSCLGCRLDRSSMWASRIMHEAEMHADDHGSSFITLTYDDAHVPPDFSLRKPDFQKFMKRLRKANKHKIRFYHCGEYGSICRHGWPVPLCDYCNTGRPHYHAIIFNHTWTDLREIGTNDNGDTLFTSPSLEATWGMGLVQVGPVNHNTAAYVARYILKKITGAQADDHYQHVDPITGEVTYVHPEYNTMSRKPGIGYSWFMKNHSDCIPWDETPVPGKGVIPGVPRYYMDQLAKTDPETYDQLKEKRRNDRMEAWEDNTSDRLITKSKVKIAQIKQLKRSL